MCHDSVLIGDTLPNEANEKVSLSLMFNDSRDQLLPGFYVKQHVFIYHRTDNTSVEPVDVTAIKYWEDTGL